MSELLRCEECAAELVDSGYPKGKTCPVCNLRDRLRDEINRREQAEAKLARVVEILERIVEEERSLIFHERPAGYISQSLHYATKALAAAKGNEPEIVQANWDL